MPDSADSPAVRMVLGGAALLLATLGVTAAAAWINADEDVGTPASAVTARHRLGPEVGENVATWVQEHRVALGTAEGPMHAVISFGRYLSVDAAAALVTPVAVDRWFVALPGLAPERVDDVDRWIDAALAQARAERAEFESLLPTTDQEDFLADYRAQVERLSQLEAALTSSGLAAGVVFAVEVRADAADLREVGARVGVRSVDAVPAGARLTGPVRALMPDETVKAGTPPVREQPLG